MDIGDAEEMFDDIPLLFVTAFKEKLCGDLDNVNLIYCWSLGAAMDGRRCHLAWMRRIWENKSDWPQVTSEYPSLQAFKNRNRAEESLIERNRAEENK